VASLVTRDLVERRASNQDGRLSHLHLTPKGQTTYQAIATALHASGADGGNALPADTQDVLIELLNATTKQYQHQVMCP
jgi:DNA-binding MarR family transcriptional regulator